MTCGRSVPCSTSCCQSAARRSLCRAPHRQGRCHRKPRPASCCLLTSCCWSYKTLEAFVVAHPGPNAVPLPREWQASCCEPKAHCRPASDAALLQRPIPWCPQGQALHTCRTRTRQLGRALHSRRLRDSDAEASPPCRRSRLAPVGKCLWRVRPGMYQCSDCASMGHCARPDAVCVL